MIKRKSMFTVLILVLLFITMSTSFAVNYNDTDGHWANSEIEKWSELGLLMGSNGDFNPNNNITRGEMAVIINRLMDYQKMGENIFTDLDDTWYTQAILKNSRLGILRGYNGNVRPMDSITREEAVVMLSRALEIKEVNEDTSFADDRLISNWAKGYIKAFSTLDYINGKPDGMLAPNSPITRAEVVKIIDNTVAKWITEPGEYTGDFEGIVIINTEDVTLKNSTITGDLIIAQGVAEGEITFDNVTVTGNTIVKGGGENSIYFNDCSLNGFQVLKEDGNIKIVLNQSTSIKFAKLESGAMLVGDGFENIVIPTDALKGSEIVLNGDCKNLEIQAGNIDLIISRKSSVDNIKVSGDNANLTVEGDVKNIDIEKDTKNTVIRGTGSVDEVSTDGQGTRVDTYGTEVTVGENANDTQVRGEEVSAGETQTPEPKSSEEDNNNPPKVTEGEELQSGIATPASLDNGVTAPAIPYEADMDTWFSDSDNNSLTYTIVSADNNGNDASSSISILGSNITYTPMAAHIGSTTEITIKAYDGKDYTSDFVTITVDINPIPNSAPTKTDIDDQLWIAGNSISFSLETYFFDVDNDGITYAITPTLPTGLSLNSATGLISGTTTEIMQTQYTVTASDENSASTQGTFNIEIEILPGTLMKNISEDKWVIDNTNGTHIGIWTIEDLHDIRNNLAGKYVLMNDLDFTLGSSYRDNFASFDADGDGTANSIISELTPQDIVSPANLGFDPIRDFTGEFIGSNHSISNLYINRPAEDNVGLFGSITSSWLVTDLIIDDARITGRNNVGILAGRVYNNQFIIASNHINNATIVGNDNVGGFVGILESEITNPKIYVLTENDFDGSITASNNVGGIIGKIYSGALIVDSEADSVINGNANIGGIAGYAYIIDADMFKHGDVVFELNNSSGTINGKSNLGGILGNASIIDPSSKNRLKISIEESFSKSDINSSEVVSSSSIGGIAGNYDGKSLINYCYYDGDINLEANGSNVGGIAGTNVSSDITNSYSIGTINVLGNDNTIGGLVGNNQKAIRNSYSTSLITATATTGGNCNIGGIAGKSSGDISQSIAFNEKLDVLGSFDTVSSRRIVGSNTGSLSYNYGYGFMSGTDFGTALNELTGANGARVYPESLKSVDFYKDLYFGTSLWDFNHNSTSTDFYMGEKRPVIYLGDNQLGDDDGALFAAQEAPYAPIIWGITQEDYNLVTRKVKINLPTLEAGHSYSYKITNTELETPFKNDIITGDTVIADSSNFEIDALDQDYLTVYEFDDTDSLIKYSSMKLEIIYSLLGDGSEANPYQISKVEDLLALSDTTRANLYSRYDKAYELYDAKHYKIVNNIDFADPNSYHDPEHNMASLGGWVYNGSNLSTTNTGSGYSSSFTSKYVGGYLTYPNAIIDGNGKKITRLYINNSTDYDVGLFSCFGGEIKNLNMERATITSSKAQSNTGVFVGRLLTLSGTRGKITGCSVENSTIIGTRATGGIVGSVTRSDISGCSATNVVVTSNDPSTYGGTGGLVGAMYDTTTIAGIFPTVTSSNSSSCTVSGVNAGGIIGLHFRYSLNTGSTYTSGLTSDISPLIGLIDTY